MEPKVPESDVIWKAMKLSAKHLEEKMILLMIENSLLQNTIEVLSRNCSEIKTVVRRSVGRLIKSVATRVFGWICVSATLFWSGF